MTTNPNRPKIPVERRYQDETLTADINWQRAQAMYQYLSYRFVGFGYQGMNPKNQARLREIEATHNITLPMLTNEHLPILYAEAVVQAKRQYGNFPASPFDRTPDETKALKKYRAFFARKKHCLACIDQYLALTPDGLPNKMLLGSHVPDLILLGIRPTGTTLKFGGIVVEINGRCHDQKAAKDLLLKQHAEAMGLFVYDIENAGSVGKLVS